MELKLLISGPKINTRDYPSGPNRIKQKGKGEAGFGSSQNHPSFCFAWLPSRERVEVTVLYSEQIPRSP